VCSNKVRESVAYADPAGGLLLAAALSSLSAQAVPDTPVRRPAATPPLSSEARGDIFMAEKKYREAIEVYQTGSPQDAVVQNKLGIAYQRLCNSTTPAKLTSAPSS